MSKLCPPDRGSKAEIVSLNVQVKKQLQGREPTGEELENAISRVVEMYPSCEIPRGFEGEKLWISRHKIRKVFADLNPTSSSGYPWMLKYPTKGDFVTKNPELLIDEVINRLEIRLLTPVASFEELEDPSELVSNGLCDPVRIFVKNEFHSIEKFKEGRMRLISNVSVVDEVIERLLYTEQNKSHQDNCFSGRGTAVGWDISTDEGAIKSYNSVKENLADAADSDISGFDISVRLWGFKAEAEARRRMNKADPKSCWHHLNLIQFYCTAHSVYVTSDGNFYCTTIAGIQNSGKFLTSYSNSVQRNMLSVLMGCKWTISMGDDNVSTWVDHAVEKAAAFGFRLKNYKRVEEAGFEFCSHMFTEKGNIPLNPDKGFANLLSKEPSRADHEDFFLRVYRNISDHQKNVYQQVLDLCGYMDALEPYAIEPTW